jgi:hypothetical protein
MMVSSYENNKAHLIELYKRVLGAPMALPLVCTGKAAPNWVLVQVEEGQIDAVRAASNGPVER